MVFEILPFVALALVEVLIRTRGAHPSCCRREHTRCQSLQLEDCPQWIGTTSISRRFFVIAVQTASATSVGVTSPAIGLGFRPVTAHIPASLTKVGLITDTPTPVPQSSSRSARPNPRMPNLVALYMDSPPAGSLPAMDAMKTMWPDLRSSIPGSNFAASTMPARRLTA